ncbi:primosomal protein N' [bacterium]|nr:primosomal protein N' [candidate division CSSED10-310 bacterium]
MTGTDGVFIARVVPDAPVDGLFSYLVPPELAQDVEPGRRVLVPFGHRRITGYVVELAREAGDFKRLEKVLDDEQVLSPELLRFTRTVAEYYATHWSHVLRTALPTLRNTAEQHIYHASPKLIREYPDGDACTRMKKNARIILELLVVESSVTAARIKEVTGLPRIAPLMKELSAAGLVVEERRVAMPKRFAATEAAFTAVVERMPPGGRYSARTRELFALLRNSGQPAPISLLRASFGNVAPLLRTLEQKGWIRRLEVPVKLDPTVAIRARNALPLELLEEQRRAYEAIRISLENGGYQAFLLHGVTGSGKTEVYLQLIEQVLLNRRQAVVLVPEIAMTPLMISRFKGRFPGLVAVLHSAMRPRDRDDQWRRVRAGELRIVIGPRSAVFAPCPEPGLFIVDEEHDGSYKQDNEPFYHGRDMAVMRAYMCGVPVVLGSATPSVESYYNAQTGKYICLGITRRVLSRPLPALEVVDMRSRLEAEQPVGALAPRLVDAVRGALAGGRQVIILLNRRGYSTFLVCKDCLAGLECPHCSVSLVFHATAGRVLCHHCGYAAEPPAVCPNCGGKVINYLGLGIQKLEEEFRETFPDAGVLRLDSDVVRRYGTFQHLLQDFEDGKYEVLLGTQIVAKGHDFPNVALVGVVAADAMLALPDFRAAEREYALLTQVAGRSGRGDEPGLCLIQSLYPEHYSVKAVVDDAPAWFYEKELAVRRRLKLPPFTSLVLLKIRHIDRRRAYAAAAAMRDLLRSGSRRIQVMGPAPAPIFKRKDEYQWQLLLRSVSRPALHAHLRDNRARLAEIQREHKCKLAIDVDPYDVM